MEAAYLSAPATRAILTALRASKSSSGVLRSMPKIAFSIFVLEDEYTPRPNNSYRASIFSIFASVSEPSAFSITTMLPGWVTAK